MNYAHTSTLQEACPRCEKMAFCVLINEAYTRVIAIMHEQNIDVFIISHCRELNEASGRSEGEFAILLPFICCEFWIKM